MTATSANQQVNADMSSQAVAFCAQYSKVCLQIEYGHTIWPFMLHMTGKRLQALP